jgi:hypothetical protein
LDPPPQEEPPTMAIRPHITKEASTAPIAIEDDTVERYSFGDAATPIGCDQQVIGMPSHVVDKAWRARP